MVLKKVSIIILFTIFSLSVLASDTYGSLRECQSNYGYRGTYKIDCILQCSDIYDELMNLCDKQIECQAQNNRSAYNSLERQRYWSICNSKVKRLYGNSPYVAYIRVFDEYFMQFVKIVDNQAVDSRLQRYKLCRGNQLQETVGC